MKIVKSMFVAMLIAVPTLSATAAEVIFAGEKNGQFDLFIADLSTSQIKQLTETPANEVMPTVSPDRGRVAFISNRSGAESLYLMPIDNASETTDISAGMGAYGYPAFSPSGGKILARYAPDPQEPMIDTQIVILDPQTRHQEIVIDSGKLKTSENSDSVVVVDRPVWVSEALIAYVLAEYSDLESGRISKSTIYMFDLKKREQVRVAGGESYFNEEGSPMGFKATMPVVFAAGELDRTLVFTAIRGHVDREPMKFSLSGSDKGIVELGDAEFFGPLFPAGDGWVYGVINDEGTTGLAWRAKDLKEPRRVLPFVGRIVTPAIVR